MAAPSGSRSVSQHVDVFRCGSAQVKDKKKWPRKFLILDNVRLYVMEGAPEGEIDRVGLRQGSYGACDNYRITRLTVVEATKEKRASLRLAIFNPKTRDLVHELHINPPTSIDRTMWMDALKQAVRKADAVHQVQAAAAAARLPLVPEVMDLAYSETKPKRLQFERKQRGVPLTYRNQFFFVRYGTQVMQKEQQRRKLIMEVVMYSTFVALLLSYIMLNVHVPSGAYMREAITRDFTRITVNVSGRGQPVEVFDLRTTGELYDWLEEYAESSPVFRLGRIGRATTVLGAVRLRQARVPADVCETDIEAANEAMTLGACFGRYSLTNADTAPFGPGTPGQVSFPARVDGTYSYTSTVESLKATSNGTDLGFSYPVALARFTGPLGGSYPPSAGYVVDLPLNVTRASAILEQLRADQWIDGATRAVFLSFSSYNPNVNLFGFTQLLVEMSPSGAMAANVAFRPMRLPGQEYKDPSAFDDLWLRVLLGLVTAVYFVRLYLAVRADGASVWDALDLVNLAIVLASLAVRALWFTSPYISRAPEYLNNTDYINLEGLGWLMNIERAANGFNLLLCFFKFFKFLRVDIRLSVVLAIVATGARGYTSYAATLVVFLLGFALMGTLTFGQSLDAFSSVGNAFITLVNLIVGNVDYIVTFDKSTDIRAYEDGFRALETAGASSTTFFGSAVGFYAAFNFLFTILLGFMLTVIAIVSYRQVRRVVVLEQELARNRRQLNNISNLRKGKSLSERVVAEAERYVRYNEGQRVVSRIAGDPYLQRDGYLTYHGLVEAVKEVAAPSRVQSLVDRILDVERVSLSRVGDVLALFDTPRVKEEQRKEREEMDRRAALMGGGGARLGAANGQDPAQEGTSGGKGDSSDEEEEEEEEEKKARSDGGLDWSDRPGAAGDGGVDTATQRLLDAGPRDTVEEDDIGVAMLKLGDEAVGEDASSDEDEDEELGLVYGPNTPLGRIRWAQDLRSGNLLHAMVYVVLWSLHERAAQLTQRLDKLYWLQRQLLDKAMGVEERLAVMQDAFTGEPLNPWADKEARHEMVEKVGERSTIGRAILHQLRHEEEEEEKEAMRDRGERVPGEDSDLDAEDEDEDEDEEGEGAETKR